MHQSVDEDFGGPFPSVVVMAVVGCCETESTAWIPYEAAPTSALQVYCAVAQEMSAVKQRFTEKFWINNFGLRYTDNLKEYKKNITADTFKTCK